MADFDATILDAIEIPGIWQRWFRRTDTWGPWRAFLKSFFGLPMTQTSLALFKECTGRQQPDGAGYNEAWLICGRRAGKSFMLALIACYLANFKDWSEYLVPGEVGTIMVIARDRKQARTIFRYCRALLMLVPTLRQRVVRAVSEELELEGDIVIEVMTANYAAVRGYTVVALLLDEVAFWETAVDAPDADSEVIEAARPAMATIPSARMLVASSPYARRGVLWDAYRQHWGERQALDAAPLVWKAPSRVMNPSLPRKFIDEQYQRDPVSAAAEYGAEFRADIASFVAREVVDAAVVPGRYELPRLGEFFYMAFVDASGGSGSDSMTLAIAHYEGEQAERRILDCVREWVPPFSPDEVTREAAAVLGLYDISSVRGDRYGGDWVGEKFREHSIQYEPADKFKNDLYREFLAPLNSGRVELLDHPRLVSQLCALERRTARGGRESIDHPPNGHDDIANAAAGALTLAGMSRSQLSWRGML
jgi:hypothetical protein